MLFTQNTGSATCLPCVAGTYSSILGGTACTACPAGSQCLLGATQPGALAASGSVDIAVLAATRPSMKQSPMATELKNQANASTTLRAAVLGTGGLLIVLFLALAIAAQKVDSVGRLVNCASEEQSGTEADLETKDEAIAVEPVNKSQTPPANDSMWVKLDVVFSSLHFVPPGGVKEVRQTAFGGMMTIVFLVAILTVGAQLAVDNLTVVYATSIVPELPPWDPRGTYRITARAHGIGLEACNGNVLTLQTADPAEWSASGGGGGTITSAWSATGTSSSLEGGEADGSCTVVWTCQQCVLVKSSSSSATVELVAPSRAWATYVEYTIETPQLTSSATSGDASSLPVFSVQVSFRSESVLL
jgi:hypothetical protein